MDSKKYAVELYKLFTEFLENIQALCQSDQQILLFSVQFVYKIVLLPEGGKCSVKRDQFQY